MCLYPRFVKNGKYKSNKKNGGIVPQPKDPRVLYVPVGCGECMECRRQKRREWQVRMLEDIKTNTNGKFVTLTFSNQSITKLCKLEEIKSKNGYDKDNAIATKAVRLWLERWRKQYKKSIRHWLVTELGHNGTENIHLHGIVWLNEPLTELERVWQYGFVWKGKGEKQENYVSARTVNYIIKYITKQDEKHPNYKPKILSSSGIGGNYTKTNAAKQNAYNAEGTTETYRTDTGHKIAMPIYWRNKIYSDSEREKLWIEKLDKGIRWVGGEKVKANDKKAYYELVNWYRKRNSELGYGNGVIDWDKRTYENAVRELMINRRVEKVEKLVEDTWLEFKEWKPVRTKRDV